MKLSQNESKFWKTLKWHIEKSGADVVLTRIENSQTPGIPDLLFCDTKRNLHLIELKVTSGWQAKLSPFQISFAVRHRGAKVWTLVQQNLAADPEIHLYSSDQTLRLVERGMKKTTPYLTFTLPSGIDNFLKAIEGY